MKKLWLVFIVLVSLVACRTEWMNPTILPALTPTLRPSQRPTAVVIHVTAAPTVARPAGGNSVSACSASEYKTEATAQMKRLQAVMTGIDLQDKAAISEDKRRVKSILGDINSMRCRKAYPLKQETLEYTARHFIDALEYVESGDLEGMAVSINRMELNVNSFYDWSFDMD